MIIESRELFEKIAVLVSPSCFKPIEHAISRFLPVAASAQSGIDATISQFSEYVAGDARPLCGVYKGLESWNPALESMIVCSRLNWLAKTRYILPTSCKRQKQ